MNDRDDLTPAPAEAAPSGVVSSAPVAATELASRPWLAHYSPSVAPDIAIPEHALSWLLDEAGRTFSGATALEYYGTRISYAQLLSLAERFARALVKLGVKPGDRISLCLPNVPQFPIAFFGALKAGAVVVPTNPLYTQPELEHQLNDAGVKVMVVIDLLYPTVVAVRPRTPTVEHVIVAGISDYFPKPLAIAYAIREARENRSKPHFDPKVALRDASVHRFKDEIGSTRDARGFEAFPLPAPAKPDDLALLQYTGGTTGVAKGAMLSHRNLLANAAQCWEWNDMPTGSKNTSLCVAPFFHVYGLTVGMNLSILAGATMALLPRFTVADTLKAIEKYKPTLFPGVPTMYLALAREVEKKPRNLSSIQVCISGSAPLPAEVQKRFERLSGAKVVEGYGLTEASPVTHCNPVFGERRSGTIGLPLPNTNARIIDPDTWETKPVGEQGEIAVAGPQVMQGYWNRPDDSAQMLHDGWLRTGDIGIVDADGYFSVLDRAKDIIIASGYKVFPRDVEEVLYEHPKVLEAAVIGMPDEYRGETVRAYIIPKPGETLTADELAAFTKERLAVYKVPKEYVFRETLPKTLVGKVLRRQLREEAIAEMQGAQAAK
ncbi:MAG: long-chain fatty acid--CoA ligase [Ktedonobacterales bacterium]